MELKQIEPLVFAHSLIALSCYLDWLVTCLKLCAAFQNLLLALLTSLFLCVWVKVFKCISGHGF